MKKLIVIVALSLSMALGGTQIEDKKTSSIELVGQKSNVQAVRSIKHRLKHRSHKNTNKLFAPSASNNAVDATPLSSNQIGMRALVYTNQFRVQQGKARLVWNQKLADLAYGHSKNMGLGKVPFGHTGFQARVNRFPVVPRAAGENVFMGTIRGDIARIAVNAWINSPGHRANLLGNYNKCGIGAYQNAQGVWYITQLFGLF